MFCCYPHGMNEGYALLAAFAVMLVSLSGVLFTRGVLHRWAIAHLPVLATFSAGVFIVVVILLADEAIHEGGWVVGLCAIILGAVLIESIRYLFPEDHHHHGEHDHSHSPIDGRRVLMSDALHNVGDGVLIVGAFAVDVWIGIAATVGILLHEVVQEVSEYFVLRSAGYSDREALVRNFVVSSSILVGVVIAVALSAVPVVLSILSGLAAGGFIAVLARDLLPHAWRAAERGNAPAHAAAILLGAALMIGMQFVAPHTHSEDEHEPAHESDEHEDFTLQG